MSTTLNRKLARKSKLAPGPQAAWKAVAAANRIFGAAGWSRETLELRNPANQSRDGAFTSAYVAKVRISIPLEDGSCTRESHGCGEGRGATAYEAHDRGLKAAELDATFRALASLGPALGLDGFLNGAPAAEPKERKEPTERKEPKEPDGNRETGANVEDPDEPAGGAAEDEPGGADGFPGDRPIPSETRSAFASSGRAASNGANPGGPVLDADNPDVAEESEVDGIEAGEPDSDSHVLLPKTRRLRSPHHLAHVRGQPCLVCGRNPTDAHHLRFVQPRAMAKKVSDEFTVPLCRRHHDLLHRDPHEQAWWDAYKIDPLAIAAELWAESHQVSVAGPRS